MCIHVRRTDYLDSDKFRRFVFSKHEILNAIETECQSGNNRFIICSDDIDWCIDNISLPKADIVFHSPDLKSYNDLYLMASCKKILSNGSFFGLTARYLHQIVL